jgi:glucoamylase
MFIQTLIALALVVLPSLAVADSCETLLVSWLDRAQKISVEKLLQNISPPDAEPGAVIAARTRVAPNYYYHWVRDAGLVAQSALQAYADHKDSAVRDALKERLLAYAAFSAKLQKVEALTGLGEPKFHVDGSAYNEPWGRPQNDSPAIRASSLIQLAQLEIKEGRPEIARQLYDGHSPLAAIKNDLEFTAHHWREPSFDLWEEVRGAHFYTRMVQHRALREGAELARQLNDDGAARWYDFQAGEIEHSLVDFWDETTQTWMTTAHRREGLDYKNSNVDTALILGLIHGLRPEETLQVNDHLQLSWGHPSVLATLNKVVAAFADLYEVNRLPSAPGKAIGRYPEDRYGGADFNGGNPWPMTTLAIAEALYNIAVARHDHGDLAGAEELILAADEFVARVKFHAHADLSLNEQIHRHNGHMTSVADLTWNYAAIITTHAARLRALWRR